MALHSLGFETITVAASAIGFTAANLANGANALGDVLMAQCVLETANIRMRADGTDPTATVGSLIRVGATFKVWGDIDLRSIRFIRDGATSGSLSVEYFGTESDQ